jgi:hypothetical protein
VGIGLTHLIGPDGAAIFKINNVREQVSGGEKSGHKKHTENHEQLEDNGSNSHQRAF